MLLDSINEPSNNKYFFLKKYRNLTSKILLLIVVLFGLGSLFLIFTNELSFDGRVDFNEATQSFFEIGQLFSLNTDPFIGIFFILLSFELMYLMLTWFFNSKYYYGVNKNEVNGNRAEHIGKSARNTGVGLSISTPVFFGGFTQLSLQRTWFSEEITDSPLVEDHGNITARLMYTRNF